MDGSYLSLARFRRCLVIMLLLNDLLVLFGVFSALLKSD